MVLSEWTVRSSVLGGNSKTIFFSIPQSKDVLVYYNYHAIAKKSITQLRQLYFKMKDEIFGKARLGGISFNTLGLEKLLKEEFTEHVCMDDESYPR